MAVKAARASLRCASLAPAPFGEPPKRRLALTTRLFASAAFERASGRQQTGSKPEQDHDKENKHQPLTTQRLRDHQENSQPKARIGNRRFVMATQDGKGSAWKLNFMPVSDATEIVIHEY